MVSKSTEIPRVQITLDSYVAELVIGMEAQRTIGENRKEIANNILREWFRLHFEEEDSKLEELRALGRTHIEQLE